MIKALLLIFEPIATWDRILLARRNLGFILVAYLLPMVLLCSAAEGYGLAHWGKWQSGAPGVVPRLKHFSPAEAFLIESAQFLLSLLVVFLGARLVKALGETFHGRHTYTQSFTVVAYGLSPLFLCRLLDAFAGVQPWVTWAIGIVLCVAALYQGVPRLMEPDPPHAFGLYLMSVILLVFISGLVRFVTAWYLQGRFTKLEALVAQLAARLP
jgi:uncharacterized membrane protein YecN with MAPEG domain